MIYDIRMEIEYSYDRPAASGRNLLRLMPADLPLEQRLIAGSLTIEPQPREWQGGSDFFQNVTNEVVQTADYSGIKRARVAPQPPV